MNIFSRDRVVQMLAEQATESRKEARRINDYAPRTAATHDGIAAGAEYAIALLTSKHPEALAGALTDSTKGNR